MDCSPPGSSVHGILQARVLEWAVSYRLFNLSYLFLKSLLNLSQYCFCFMGLFFGPEACGILAPQPGIQPTPVPPILERKVLTTGPPGKSLNLLHICFCIYSFLFGCARSLCCTGFSLVSGRGCYSLVAVCGRPVAVLLGAEHRL